jgi:hypothetical protein
MCVSHLGARLYAGVTVGRLRPHFGLRRLSTASQSHAAFILGVSLVEA